MACPICSQEFTRIDLLEEVCAKHFHFSEEWIVTVCPDCKVARFSQTKGVCDSCLAKSQKVKGFGFNHNHRAGLANSGMGCKENG